jgi:hypothetical protein
MTGAIIAPAGGLDHGARTFDRGLLEVRDFAIPVLACTLREPS